MTAKTARVRPTVAAMKALEARIKELETLHGDGADDETIKKLVDLQKVHTEKLELIDKLQEEISTVRRALDEADDSEIQAKLRDANELLKEASTRIQALEGQLADALEGKDHSQGADLPPIAEGRERFFVDLGPVHADYLRRAATREGRAVSNMIERIIRIDWAASPDKAGAIQLGEGSSMPAADAPQIPVTR